MTQPLETGESLKRLSELGASIVLLLIGFFVFFVGMFLFRDDWRYGVFVLGLSVLAVFVSVHVFVFGFTRGLF